MKPKVADLVYDDYYLGLIVEINSNNEYIIEWLAPNWINFTALPYQKKNVARWRKKFLNVFYDKSDSKNH